MALQLLQGKRPTCSMAVSICNYEMEWLCSTLLLLAGTVADNGDTYTHV
jgi:hypothetical protein